MDPESHSSNPPFRANRQVLLVLALLLLALALPLAMFIVGIRGVPKKTAATPDAVELRRSVESIASQHFGEPTLSDGRREIPFSGSAPEMSARRKVIEAAARSLGGSILPGEAELLIGIPRDRAGEFEVAALLPAARAGSEPVGDSILYRITFSTP
jgi:hypothetical protein